LCYFTADRVEARNQAIQAESRPISRLNSCLASVALASESPCSAGDVVVAVHPTPGPPPVHRGPAAGVVTAGPAGVAAVVVPRTGSDVHHHRRAAGPAGNGLVRHSPTLAQVFDSSHRAAMRACRNWWCEAAETPTGAIPSPMSPRRCAACDDQPAGSQHTDGGADCQGGCDQHRVHQQECGRPR